MSISHEDDNVVEEEEEEETLNSSDSKSTESANPDFKPSSDCHSDEPRQKLLVDHPANSAGMFHRFKKLYVF